MKPKAEAVTPMRRRLALLRRLGPIGPMALVAGTVPPLGALVLLAMSVTLADPLRGGGLLTLLLFVLGLSVLGGLSLLPTYAQALVAGWIFGAAVGVPAAIAGVMGACVIAYILVRYWSGRRAVDVVEEHPKARAIYRAVAGRGFWRSTLVVTLIRLPPNSPFALTNVLLGSLRMPMSSYLLGTLLGMTPRVAAAAFIGAGMSNPREAAEHSPWLIAAGVAVLVIVLVVLGKLAKRALAAMDDGSEQLKPQMNTDEHSWSGNRNQEYGQDLQDEQD